MGDDLSKWNALYSHHEGIRDFFKEPYVGAIAPIVASAIDLTKKPEVRVLVIGGGTGRFSRDLLPKIQEILKKKRLRVKLMVIESDITEAVRAAPSKNKVIADIHALPFKDKSFDIVIGESMIHQGEPAQVDTRAREIARVLSDQGSFIHTGDFIPDPNDWLSDEIRAKLGLRGRSLAYTIDSDKARDNMDVLSKAVHIELFSKLLPHYRANGLNTLFAEVTHRSLVDSSLKRQLLGSDATANNSITFEKGIINTSRVRNIHKRKKELVYSGYLQIASRLKAAEIVKHSETFH